MRRRSILFLSLLFLFLFTNFLYAQNNPTWKNTLLVELKPHLTDKEVKQIAKRYGCKIGHIYRFNYDDRPHIAVKFFIKDKDKTPLQVLFDMEEDPRIISVNLDMPGRFFVTADEVREKVWEENSYMLKALRWFDTDDYFNEKYDGEVNTLIIELDTGVAYEKYPWMREYLFRIQYDREEDRFYIPDDPSGGVVEGWDVTKGDSPDDVWPGPLDDEEVEFRKRHGTIGAQIMGVLSSGSRIVPIRIGKSSEFGFTYSNMKLGLKMALSTIQEIEEILGKDYNVVVNMSLGLWLNPVIKIELRQDWIGEDGQGVEYAEERIFPMFKDDGINREKWRDKIEQAGYEPEDIEYQDLLEDEDLLDIAIEWLFHAIWVEGTLSDKLKPTQDRGIWGELSTMKEEGWIIVASTGYLNYNEKAYPAAREEVEAVDGVSINEDCNCIDEGHYTHGDWVKLAAPESFSVYNEDEDEFYTPAGTSVSTFITSALYAQVWDIAPNLDDEEINRIVKETAMVLDRAGDKPDKEIIHPYRAIRTAWVYGKIKYYVNNIQDIDELRRKIEQVLDDTDDARSFADIGTMDEIFVTASPGYIQPLPEILDILIQDIIELVPADPDNIAAYASNIEYDQEMVGIASSPDFYLSTDANHNNSITPSLSENFDNYFPIF